MGLLVTRTSVVSGGGGTGSVDLSGLGSQTAANTTAYAALNVSAMSAGTAFNDPATSVRTVKVTANGTPASAQFCNEYSTLGLQVSQAWGAGSDQYTIWFMSTTGTAYLCDYQLGGTTSNYRSGPGGESRVAFSRLPGSERIMYVASSTQLRRYDTQTNAYADTGSFPYSWTTNGNNDTWLQLNDGETWATAKYSGGATALNLSTGSTIQQAIGSFDELYSGANNVAFINNGASSLVWNLTTNTTTAIGALSGRSSPFHLASMRNYWVWIDTNAGGGVFPLVRCDESGTLNSSVSASGYWNQLHNSGHWKNGSGTDQWFLLSTWSSGVSSWMQYNNIFYNLGSGGTKVLGGHYSTSPATTADDYRSQPHTTQSHDGKIALFTSNMLDGSRVDVFIQEVPRS